MHFQGSKSVVFVFASLFIVVNSQRKEFAHKGANSFHQFWKGCVFEGSKQEVTKMFTSLKLVGNPYTSKDIFHEK